MSVQEQLNSNTAEIYRKISKHVPEIEWKIHAPLIEKINRLKKKKKMLLSLHTTTRHQKFIMASQILLQTL